MKTDHDRDLLRSNQSLIADFCNALFEVGYPADAIPYVAFAFEAQETVDRDYAGSWWYAVK